jgi:hypothetical protein
VASAHYIVGLGCLGFGDIQKAKDQFNQALKAKSGRLVAKMVLQGLK